MKLLTIKRDIKDNKNLFYLGPWCLQNYKKINLYNKKIISHPWENHKVKKRFNLSKKKYFFYKNFI